MKAKALENAVSPHGLSIMGISKKLSGPTVILVGAEPSLWPIFLSSPEYKDGQDDPLDRWSKRIIGAVAARFDAIPQYPSDGPPYPPFISWALESGEFFQSPVGMLVHPRAGLMISLRGALIVDHWDSPLVAPTQNPCNACVLKPCQSACPVAALSADAPYDVAACKSYLGTSLGADCMSAGCKARRICPLSQKFGRSHAQSAYHMDQFKGV